MVKPNRDRAEALIIIGVVSVAVGVGLFLFFLGAHVGWVPLQATCIERPDCFPAPGETLISVLAGKRLVVDGARYWLLQNQRAPDDATSPPLLYTHNANLAAFLYYLAAIGGAENPVRAVVMLAIAAFVGGLVYAWAFVRELTKSAVFSLVFLFILATEHHFNLLFGLNALRGWHWIALFGVCFHFARFIRRTSRLDGALFIVWAFVAFQVGYDFFAVVVCSAFGVLTFSRLSEGRRLQSPRMRQVTRLVIIAIMIPVMLRQAQVIGALGWDFWARDFYYTAVIKTPVLANFMPLPTLEEIDSFYRRHHAVRNVASPTPGVWTTLELAVVLWREYWAPFLGRLQWHVSLAGLWAAVFWVIGAQSLHVWSGLATRLGFRDDAAETCTEGLRNAGVLFVVVGGQVAGLFLFLPFTIYFWIRYAFPLLIAGLVMGMAFGCWVAIQVLRWSVAEIRSGGRSWVGAVGTLLAAAFLIAVIGDHVYRQVESYRRWVFLSAEESEVAQQRILRILETYGAETS